MNSKHLRKACGTYLKEETALWSSSVFIWALQLIKVSNSWESLEMYKSILEMLMAFVNSTPLKSRPTYLLISYPPLVDSLSTYLGVTTPQRIIHYVQLNTTLLQQCSAICWTIQFWYNPSYISGGDSNQAMATKTIIWRSGASVPIT